jgi:hypothetical protein
MSVETTFSNCEQYVFGNPLLYPMGTGYSFSKGEADISPPSSAEIKNAWSYTSTPPIRLNGVVLS